MLQTVTKSFGFKDINDLLKPQLEALIAFLDQQVLQFEPEIRDYVAYCLKNQGKHIRPTLLFLSGLKKDNPNTDDLVRAAAILELVHIATLVHDDIIDEALVRRNFPTVAQKFGPDMAVLLGDALFSHALKLATDFPTTDVCKHVAHSTRQVCSGEILQSLSKKEDRFSKEHYFKVIDLKTAELFSVACRLGAKLSNYPEDFVQALAQFGRHLGIAYQIFDDMADLLSSEKSIGKTLGTDLESGKWTLPVLILLEKMPIEEQKTLKNALLKGEINRTELLNSFRRYDVISDVVIDFSFAINEAKSLLEQFDGLEAVTCLNGIIGVIQHKMDELA